MITRSIIQMYDSSYSTQKILLCGGGIGTCCDDTGAAEKLKRNSEGFFMDVRTHGSYPVRAAG